MVRSHWKEALVLTLVSLGVARAQQPPPRPSAPANAERFVTIQEPNRPAQKCRVLTSWKLDNGNMAHQVQCVTTGEISTLVDSPTEPSRVFGWGKDNKAPAGAPLPPGATRPQIGAPVVPVSATQSAAQPQQRPAVEYKTIQEHGKGPQKCRVVRKWTMADGAAACEVQSLDSGEMMTLVEMSAPQAVQGSRVKAVATRIFHWGRHSTPPGGVPVPTAVAQAPAPKIIDPQHTRPAVAAQPQTPAKVVQVPPPAPAKTAQLPPPPARVAQTPQKVSPPPAQQMVVTPANKLPVVEAPRYGAQAATTPKPIVEPAKPSSDWRKSHGGPDELRTLPKPPMQVAQAQPPMPQSLPKPPASVTVKDNKQDPLANPLSFASRKVEEKIPSLKREDFKPATTPPAPAVKPAGTPTPVQTVSVQPERVSVPSGPPAVKNSLPPSTAALPPVEKAATKPLVSAQPQQQQPLPPQFMPAAPGAPIDTANKVPLGSASVLAASNGLDRPIQYVPVPVVTVPNPKQPPMPPVPEIPQAPQLNQFVNAFTPPQQPQQMQQPGGPQMMASQMQRPMMPNGYPMTQHPAHMTQQPPVGYGYAMTAQQVPMYPQMAGYPQQMPGRGAVPHGYQGPQPPNPYGQQPMVPQQMMPVYVMPPMPQAMGPRQGQTAEQAAAAGAVQQMVHVLKTSGYPSQREWAVNNLATCDCRAHPEALQALVVAAKSDPAATVRAGCAYNLARLKVGSEPVLAALQQLKADTDPRVRQEAEQALARLGSAPAQNAVLPAGGTNRQ